MASPYELLAGLALLRERKRRSHRYNEGELQEWSGFQMRFGEMNCLIPRDQVEEVITPVNVAHVRGVAAWVRGVVYCHAQLVTLIDVGRLLFAHGGSLNAGRIFVVRGSQEWFGLQSASFDGVRHIWSDTPECEPPEHLSGAWLQYVQQWLLLDDNPVAVLDADKLVAALENGEVR